MLRRLRQDLFQESTLVSRQPCHCVSIIFAVSVLSTLSCAWITTAPVRPKPPSPSERVGVEFLEVPEKGCPGDPVTLTIRTLPGNQCEAWLPYQVENKRKSLILTPQIADSKGICTWQWRIPDDILPDGVNVYTVVRFGDEEHNSLPPRWIQIVRCDE